MHAIDEQLILPCRPWSESVEHDAVEIDEADPVLKGEVSQRRGESGEEVR